MKRGPTAKSIELQIAQGTYRKDRHGNPEDIVKFSKPEGIDPPDYLNDEGIRIWNNHYQEFVELGVIQSSDVESFGYLCLLHQLIKYADDECGKIGWVETNENGATRRPALAVQRADWMRELIQFKSRFGMFPNCRNELQADKKKPVVSSRQR
jgi:P27 family predicted phage terminase small subunit